MTVRVREVGICGTDREICDFHYGTPPIGLRAAGARARGARRGRRRRAGRAHARRPATWSRSRCAGRASDRGVCRLPRRAARTSASPATFRERGIKEADGFMTELVVEDERYLVRVPQYAGRRRRPHRAADHRGQGLGRARGDLAPLSVGADRAARARARRRSDRPPGRDDAGGAQHRDRRLLARARGQRSRRSWCARSAPTTSRRATSGSPTLSSRIGTLRHHVRGRGNGARSPSPRSTRWRRTACSSSAACPAAASRSRSTSTASCATSCSRIRSSSARSTPRAPRSRRRCVSSSSS